MFKRFTRCTVTTCAILGIFLYPPVSSALAQTELALPGQPPDRVAKLPVGSVQLTEDPKCNAKQFKVARKLIRKEAKAKVKCLGSVQHEGAGYLFVENWRISEERPGPYQLVRVIEKTASPLGDISGAPGGWIQSTSYDGLLEFISISTDGEYNRAKGWPYLRYRVTGNSVDLIPTKMFSADTNPITINRNTVKAAFAEAQAKAAEAEAAKQAELSLRDARREQKLAASRGFTSSYARGGISLGHNFAMKGRTGCFSLPALKTKLDKVVNEMEVYNNSTWMFRKGCDWVAFEDPETYQKVGWYNNGKFFISIVFIYSITGQGYWKPVEVIPNRLAARSPCFNNYVQRTENGLTIRIYGRNDAGIIPGCMNDYPFLGEQLG